MVHSAREVIPYAVNFSIVVVILASVLRKPARKFLYQRHERMKDQIESAAIAHKKAEARVEVARRAMQQLASEEASLLEKERKYADQEKNEILTKAKAEVARVQHEADQLAQAEQEAALERVKGQFLREIVSGAEESLKRGLKRDDHTAILKRAQNSIEVGV